ncbi:MAG TPA: hypothetical protein VL334_00825 [Anaerolineae bacterium]|nr:hypothetical protein [Anaerolineae bacterium]
MDAIIRAIGDALRTGAIWELNGCLALLYTAWAHLAALVVAGAWAALLWWTPPGQRRANPGPDQLSGQRPWLLGIAVVVILAAFLAQAPAPALLAAMTLSGLVAVTLDRFNPEALRWRIAGGLALYALAALAYLGYGAYLNSLDALAWAEALGGQGEAAATLAQGRAFISTLATWGLWLILPLAYFSLLAQGLLVHPPLTGGTPEHMITTVRTRGQGK